MQCCRISVIQHAMYFLLARTQTPGSKHDHHHHSNKANGKDLVARFIDTGRDIPAIGCVQYVFFFLRRTSTSSFSSSSLSNHLFRRTTTSFTSSFSLSNNLIDYFFRRTTSSSSVSLSNHIISHQRNFFRRIAFRVHFAFIQHEPFLVQLAFAEIHQTRLFKESLSVFQVINHIPSRLMVRFSHCELFVMYERPVGTLQLAIIFHGSIQRQITTCIAIAIFRVSMWMFLQLVWCDLVIVMTVLPDSLVVAHHRMEDVPDWVVARHHRP
mmetsp:Transcript_1640/g.2651  ORF Transcript_1640/g.2651 Transcript_1640/m.2651 type:complete len:268 (+) Transcript_1640:275-1078(+)